MATKRKQYTAAFKAQVALAALKGDKTINELASGSRLGDCAIRLALGHRSFVSGRSLRPMLIVLRRATLNATINPNSATQAELTEMVETLKTWANLAA